MDSAIILSSLIIIIATILFYLRSSRRYWKRRNIPYVKSNLIFGSSLDIFDKSTRQLRSNAVFIDTLYRRSSETDKCIGFFSFRKPYLIVKDLDLIKRVLIADFAHFRDRQLHLQRDWDSSSHPIFFLEYDRWKIVRRTLDPLFVLGKTKAALRLIDKCANRLVDRIRTIDANERVDVKDLTNRYAMDAIGEYLFGVDVNSLENPRTEFCKMATSIFSWPSTMINVRLLLNNLTPSLIDFLKLSLVDRSLTTFFDSFIGGIVAERKSNGSDHRDFLNLLIELKNKPDLDFNNELITTQCIAFFGAGYDISSTTITFCLLELAKNPLVQRRVQNEIDEITGKNGSELTYESLQNFKYLDQVIAETQRLYPPLYMLSRKCTADYTIPGTNCIVEKNTEIIIPTYSIHRDPKYFENSDRFDPDNFAFEKKSVRHPFSFLPMGEGPKMCIGKLLGSIQVKVALILILREFEVKLTDQTKYPIEFAPMTYTLQPKYPVWLHISKRIRVDNEDDDINIEQ